MIFSSRALQFDCPRSIDYILIQLSIFQLKHLFHITVNIFASCKDCYLEEAETKNIWLEIFTVLPRNLRTIKITLGPNPVYDWFAGNMTRDKVQIKAKKFVSLRRRLATLAILLHRARRCAPDAVIVMGEWHMEHIYPGKRPCFESEFHEVAL